MAVNECALLFRGKLMACW